MQRACASTLGTESSGITLEKIYRCEHSPMRTQLFWIELIDCPTFVSVHFVRHKIGVEHFVQSKRYDRTTYTEVPNRFTPVKHSMLINAEALITMSRKRLCRQASTETIAAMQAIKDAVAAVDPDLAVHMQPNCVYRNGCPELKPCGFF